MDNAIQKITIRHMQIGGGEPMLRFEELLRLMDGSQRAAWTSGYPLQGTD